MKFKRITALMLSVAMMVGAMSTLVLADETSDDEQLQNGSDVVAESADETEPEVEQEAISETMKESSGSQISFKDGVLTIEGKINSTNLEQMISDAGIQTEEIKEIVAAEGTVINGFYLFREYESVENIDLSKSVLDPESTDLSAMFDGCTALKSVNFGDNFDTSNVIDMWAMFDGCQNLTDIYFGNKFDTSNVVDIGAMFEDCDSLTDLSFLKKFKLDSVEEMGGMFFMCDGIVDIDLSFLNTPKLKKADYIFSRCKNLKKATFGDKFITSVTDDIDELFEDSTSLEVLDLSGFNTSGVTNYDSMFCGCEKLRTIYVGDGWNIRDKSSSLGMFEDCYALVGGAGTAYDSAHTDGEYARIDGGTDNPGYLTVANDIRYSNGTLTLAGNIDAEVIKNYIETNNIANTDIRRVDAAYGTVINDGKFLFGSNVDRIEEVDLSKATLGKNVDDLSQMFEGFTILKSVTLGGRFDTSNVRDMSFMFTDCDSLTDYSFIKDLQTDNVENMFSMFESNDGIKVIDLSSIKAPKLKSVENMFLLCKNLNEVRFGDSFITSATGNISYMFARCSSLKVLDLSSFDTTNVNNFSGMFNDSTNLKTIYAGERWNIPAGSNTSRMFDGCTALIGGAGTKYDASNVDGAYAHIDGGKDNPGYLTDVACNGIEATGYSMIINDMIGINYYVSVDTDKYDLNDVVANFTWGEEGYMKSYTSSLTPVSIAKSPETNAYVTCPVAARCMTDEVTMTLNYNGKIIHTGSCRIVDYAEEVVKENESYAAIVGSMLVYGGRSQEYFNYKKEMPAYNYNFTNQSLKNAINNARKYAPSYGTSRDNTITGIKNDGFGLDYYGASFGCTSKTVIRIYFTIMDNADLSNLTVKIKGNSDDNYREATINTSGKYAYVEYEIQTPACFTVQDTYVIEVSDGSVQKEYEYNILSYFKTIQDNKDPFINVLYAYECVSEVSKRHIN